MRYAACPYHTASAGLRHRWHDDASEAAIGTRLITDSDWSVGVSAGASMPDAALLEEIERKLRALHRLTEGSAAGVPA